MTQFFEVFKGTPLDLAKRLFALKTASATGISWGLTQASGTYLITYTSATLITPAQPQ